MIFFNELNLPRDLRSTSKSALSMRLLSANADGGLSLTHFSGNNIPRYAILLYTWEADNQEVIFHNLKFGKGKDKNGYRKIQFCGN